MKGSRFAIRGMFLLLFFVVQLSMLLNAQDDFEWWNEAHHFDGTSHWTGYIIYSPYYMGPNALPVPRSEKGTIKKKGSFSLEGYYHDGQGDQTQNLRLSFYYPFLENRVAVEFKYIPFETFKMDYQTIIERRTRYLDGKGIAQGDFYFSTIIQLLKEKKFPDIALRMACRTASGTDLGNARFTDAPGYFFDLSGGKVVGLGKADYKMRFHAMTGFYSWQLNLPDNKQNDAILYGVGIDFNLKRWFINNAVEGYIGYFGGQKVIVGDPEDPVPFNDRPMIYRLKAGRVYANWEMFIGYQHGIIDFPYNSFSVGISYLFPPFK